MTMILQILPSSLSGTVSEASYLRIGPVVARCALYGQAKKRIRSPVKTCGLWILRESTDTQRTASTHAPFMMWWSRFVYVILAVEGIGDASPTADDTAALVTAYRDEQHLSNFL